MKQTNNNFRPRHKLKISETQDLVKIVHYIKESSHRNVTVTTS